MKKVYIYSDNEWNIQVEPNITDAENKILNSDDNISKVKVITDIKNRTTVKLEEDIIEKLNSIKTNLINSIDSNFNVTKMSIVCETYNDIDYHGLCNCFNESGYRTVKF